MKKLLITCTTAFFLFFSGMAQTEQINLRAVISTSDITDLANSYCSSQDEWIAIHPNETLPETTLIEWSIETGGGMSWFRFQEFGTANTYIEINPSLAMKMNGGVIGISYTEKSITTGGMETILRVTNDATRIIQKPEAKNIFTTNDTSICKRTNAEINLVSPVPYMTYSLYKTPSTFVESKTCAEGGENISFTVADAATYYTITKNSVDTFSVCESKTSLDQITVSHFPEETPVIEGKENPCQGSTEVYSTDKDNFSEYKWNVSGGTIISGSDTKSITVKWDETATIGYVELDFADVNTCTPISPVRKNVTVRSAPTQPQIEGKTTICENTFGESYTIKDKTDVTTYSWWALGGEYATMTDADPVEIDWKAAKEDARLGVTIGNVYGCTSTDTIDITINPRPTVTLDGKLEVCENDTLVEYTTESGKTNYSWDIDGGTITPSGNKATVNWGLNGNGWIKVNYENEYGCPARYATKKDVTIYPLPTKFNIEGATNVCQNDKKNYTASVADDEAYEYHWEADKGEIIGDSNKSTVKIKWTGFGLGIVTGYYIRKSTGCISEKSTYSVTIKQSVPTITGLDTICNRTTSIYTTEMGHSNYQWAVEGGTITSGGGSTDNTATIKWSAYGNNKITVNYNNANGCVAENPTEYNVRVNPLPEVPNITGKETICSNETNTLTYKVENKEDEGIYVWGIKTGVSFTKISATEISGTWENNFAAKKDTILVTYTDLNGCSANGKRPIEFFKRPVITDLEGNTTACNGVEYRYYLNIDDVNKNLFQYNWNVTGGSIVGDSNSDTINVSWSTSGAQTITVNYKNEHECSALNDKVFDINIIAKPEPTISTTEVSCTKNTATFTTEAGKNNYVWSVTEGGTIESGQGTNTVVIKWDGTGGEQTVSVNYENEGGCFADAATQKTVMVYKVPTLSLSGFEGNCYGKDVKLTASKGFTKYSFNINGTWHLNKANPILPLSTVNNGDEVYVAATTAEGCVKQTSKKSIEIYPEIKPTISSNKGTTVVQGTETTITASGGVEYEFFVNNILVQAKSATNTYETTTLNNSDEVKVVVYNTYGCSEEATLTFNILPAIETDRKLESNPTEYCHGEDHGSVTLFINNPQEDVIYTLYRKASGQAIGIGTSTEVLVVWNNVRNTALGTEEYYVDGHYAKTPEQKVRIGELKVKAVDFPSKFSIPNKTTTGCSDKSNSITLSGSVIGVDYSLYINGASTGYTLSGTGEELKFTDITTTGAYTVVAENSTGCQTTMDNTFYVTEAVPAPITLKVKSDATEYCEGQKGIEIYLPSGQSGVEYKLMLNKNEIASVTGVQGQKTSFGYQTAEGIYTVVAPSLQKSTCLFPMDGSVEITKLNAPKPFTLSFVNGENSYCAGSEGVSIYLSNQEKDVYYQLQKDGENIGEPILGIIEGATILFPDKYTKGTYSVQQTQTSLASCSSEGANKLVVSEIPMPNNLTPKITDKGICKNGTTNMYIEESEIGVVYKLYKDHRPTGRQLVGNGGKLNFEINQAGVYTITATRNDDCEIRLTKGYTINEKPDPIVCNYSYVDGTDCKNGTVITVEESEIGTKYKLFNTATNEFLDGYEIIGNGSNISFDDISDKGNTYYIVAEKDGCAIDMRNLGDIEINIEDAVSRKMIHTVNSCLAEGETLNNNITINNSEIGVNYSFYRENGATDIHIGSLAGNGGTIQKTGIDKAGEYYVIGEKDGCSYKMLNRVTVTENRNPKTYAIGGPNTFCDKKNPIQIVVGGSEPGTKYNLKRDGDITTFAVGNGNMLTFSGIKVAGDYTISAEGPNGCNINFPETHTVKFRSKPKTFTMEADNSRLCRKDGLADIYLSGTENGVTYNFTNVNSGEEFSIVSTADNNTPTNMLTLGVGFYNVSASWDGECSTNISVSPLEVAVAPQIAEDDIDVEISNTYICTEGDKSIISVSKTATNGIYDLLKDGILQNRPLNSNLENVVWEVSEVGTYQVYAYINGYKTCAAFSEDNVSLAKKDAPKLQTVTAEKTLYCANDNGSLIYVSGAEKDVIYELYNIETDKIVSTYTSNSDMPFSFNVRATNGIFIVRAHYAGSTCTTVMNDTLTIRPTETITKHAILAPSVAPTTDCDSEYEIKLRSSQNGIHYSLLLNGKEMGIVKDGTGGELSFGMFRYAGTYTVIGKNDLGCSENMNSQYTIRDFNPVRFNIIQSDKVFCKGTKGVKITSDGSNDYANYLLMCDGEIVSDTVKGTGNNLDFGYVTKSGNYTVKEVVSNQCEHLLQGIATVTEIEAPKAPTIKSANDGLYCYGYSGSEVYVSNPEVGYYYELLKNSNPITTKQLFTSESDKIYSFGLQDDGIYQVRVSAANSSCPTAYSKFVEVKKQKDPADVSIQAEVVQICRNGNARFSIPESEENVIYTVLRNGSVYGNTYEGNGGKLNISVKNAGIYTIKAQYKNSICDGIILSDEIEVTEINEPSSRSYGSEEIGENCNKETIVTIYSSEEDINYYLCNKATGTSAEGFKLVGNGGDISFNGIKDNGVYYILAEKTKGCTLILDQWGDIELNNPATAKKQVVSIPNPICDNIINVPISLASTETDVVYELYYDGDYQQKIVGNGGEMTFTMPIKEEGVYSVLAKKAIALGDSCENQMLNTVELKFEPLPAEQKFVGDKFYLCSGIASTSLKLESTEENTIYNLVHYHDLIKDTIVANVIGNGNEIVFNNITKTGEYYVAATSANGCSAIVTDYINVEEKETPTNFNIEADNSKACQFPNDTVTIYIDKTQEGVKYDLRKREGSREYFYGSYLATESLDEPTAIAKVTEKGLFYVTASWNGECEVRKDTVIESKLLPTVEEQDIPNLTASSTLVCFDYDEDHNIVAEKVELEVTNPRENIIYTLARETEFGDVNIGTIDYNKKDFVAWKVDGTTDPITYKIISNITEVPQCKTPGENTITIVAKERPKSVKLDIANRDTSIYCLPDSGIVLFVENLQEGISYDLHSVSNNGTDNILVKNAKADSISVSRMYELYNSYPLYAKTTPQATSDSIWAIVFDENPLTEGKYYVVGNYAEGSCQSHVKDTTVVLVDDSTMVCIPFEAVADTFFVSPSSELENGLNVGTVKTNDIYDSNGVDKRLLYELFTNNTSNFFPTRGTAIQDASYPDQIIYKRPGSRGLKYFGIDSVKYVVTNMDKPNRTDTAVAYIFIGNEQLDEDITVLIPNAFSPNGDGKNDFYMITGAENYQVSSKLQVFNRWGAAVYESKSEVYENNWNGTSNCGATIGNELPVGTYFYIYTLRYEKDGATKEKKYSGYIELRK